MRKLFVLIVLTALIGWGCKDKDSSNLLPNVTGESGEVVLVIEPDHWSSAIGEEFRNTLTQDYPALPQSEPMFDLVHIPYSAFTNIFKTHRNILLTKVDKNISEPKVVVQENAWAKPQLIIHIIAPDKEQLEQLVKEKGDLIVARIIKAEMSRYAENNKKYEEIGSAEYIQKQFGIRLTLPKGYSIDVDTTNFMWIENRGRGDLVQGIFIYSFDKPDHQLTTDFLFEMRDQFTKKFVPGPNRGSYMAVETDAVPYRRELKVNELDVIELRNLWKVENDFMGGPFVSLTMENEETNQVVVVDGFVYAPQFDKRKYLRQVEAILNSVQIPKKKNE